VFGSKGTIENSPAFQRREKFGKIESRRDDRKSVFYAGAGDMHSAEN
jgi:hypothetical protein